MEKQYMYMTSGFGEVTIKKVEVVKETPKQVVFLTDSWGRGFRERRCAKEGRHENFFNTWLEAHEYLTKKAEGSVEGLKSRLHSAKSYLGKIKSMKDDT